MLVGRESELSLLAERIAQLRPVAVLGEAGVGKTVLVRAAAERAGKRLFEAGALATLSWLPYLPLRRAFAREFGDGDVAYVASEVEREVADGIVFFDDLHWADTQTRALLPLLAGRVPFVAAIRRGDPATAGALEACTGAGFALVPLEPLAVEDAAQLAGRLRPDLTRAATERLVQRSGGNPFLLEELASTGEPPESLQLALRARLRQLTPVGREAMALLSVAGRPLESPILGPGLEELRSGGLVTVTDGTATVRHALLAESMVAELGDPERAVFHSRLAQTLVDPGEAARHHAAAGERAEAYERALEAIEQASHVVERASHLRLAAACAVGDEADELRLRAAQALHDVHDSEGVNAILDEIESDDPLVQAKICLLRSQVGWLTSDDVAAAAVERGVELAAGSGSDVEVELAVAHARVTLYRGFYQGADRHQCLREARAALALAQSRRHDEAAAHLELGGALFALLEPGWEEHLRLAHAKAVQEGQLAVEHRASNNLIFFSLCAGELERARSIAEQSLERLRRQRLAGPERRHRGWYVALDWHGGEPRKAVEQAEDLLAGVLEVTDRRFIEFYLCQALVDVGRHDEARRRSRDAVEEVRAQTAALGITPVDEATEAFWALADSELWAGRPTEALAAADACLAELGETFEGSLAFVGLTRAWACFELGRNVTSTGFGSVPPIAEGAPVEFTALVRLSEGDDSAASRLFDEATSLWRHRHFRGELRCLWASGEALRRAGDLERAVARLTETEQVALERGYTPLLSRIRRSLRLAGVSRSAPRRKTHTTLTARELELLELVADGLTNDEIARRLGIGRPTVVRLIRSSQQKLGARSRAQAAALAARR